MQIRTRSVSVRVSGPFLSHSALETPRRPMSWTSPARRTARASSGGRPSSSADRPAWSATSREWPMNQRVQVGEVTHRLQHLVQAVSVDDPGQAGLGVEDLRPVAVGVESAEQLWGVPAEHSSGVVDSRGRHVRPYTP